MKKFKKLAAVFAALVLALSCFVACSSGDDDDNPPSPQTSIWVAENGDTLTVSDDGTYEFVSSGKSYKGTYTEKASTGENSTGTLAGDVEGNYTVVDGTMSVVITSPFAKTIILTKSNSTGSNPTTPPASEEEESKVPGSNTPSDSDNDKAVNALEGLWMQEGTGTMGYYFSNNKYYLTNSTVIEIPSQQNLTDTSGKKYFYIETAGLPYTVSGNKIDGGSIEFTINGDKLTGSNGGTYVKVNLKK